MESEGYRKLGRTLVCDLLKQEKIVDGYERGEITIWILQILYESICCYDVPATELIMRANVRTTTTTTTAERTSGRGSGKGKSGRRVRGGTVYTLRANYDLCIDPLGNLDPTVEM